MFSLVKDYTHWLHGRWPAGLVEKLPVVDADGASSIKGVYVVGDLTGIPLLKFAADTGARAVDTICADPTFEQRSKPDDVIDLVIIGGGVSGFSAALAAQKKGLNFALVEAKQAFSTLKDFPKGKPIYTYPTDMQPIGELQFAEKIQDKESLLSSLQQQANKSRIQVTRAEVSHVERQGEYLSVALDDQPAIKTHRVIVAIGRSGNYRQLQCSGHDHEKVTHRLIDPAHYKGQKTLVVGGGDSALESAISLADAGADVTLAYRGDAFRRPKPESIRTINTYADRRAIEVHMQTDIKRVDDTSVTLTHPDNGETTLPNDTVFAMIGREAPLGFFRRSRMAISGESRWTGWLAFLAFMLVVTAIYDWKNFGFHNHVWSSSQFPDQMPQWIAALGGWWHLQVADRSTLLGTLAVSMKSRSFYYTLVYTSLIGFFGWQRVRRRNTPYVRWQTGCLFLVQLIPLFLLPEIVLPWMGYTGWFDAGFGQTVADSLFPSYISAQDWATQNWPDWGHPRAYWHAYGLVLAWPLNVYNVFTPTPMTGWLIISAVQTFVLIPLLVYRYGKGAYCGWICSCGALAETLGDTQRHKMPHGPFWNRLNMLGQAILLIAVVLLVIRIGGWIWPDSWMHTHFDLLLKGENKDYKLVNPLSWKWGVDVLLGGILGVGLYFKYSGRIWCRFACPLAALMHIYARFSRFRIFADKSKCISCNQCTSVCHQGIDVMSFANRGEPMSDPQCVRCSACVQTCPTGVLQFGEIDAQHQQVDNYDKLPASRVQMAEAVELIPVKHV
ncbi:Putative electron transport protein YccM [BD1-7 clade bacterium]|uniref:Electron transport protein YccM n=1 Tax=BD1-7 clade bacterium TaxID=2029982 RepID=A0A5S9QDA7_9GAMM|nr:Putative electron transport protein YccM [BD1-7 clade bacterium]